METSPATRSSVSNYLDQNVTVSYQRTNATYALLYAFDPASAWLEERQNQLDAYRQQGLGENSRKVVSETLTLWLETGCYKRVSTCDDYRAKGCTCQDTIPFWPHAQEAGHGSMSMLIWKWCFWLGTGYKTPPPRQSKQS